MFFAAIISLIIAFIKNKAGENAALSEHNLGASSHYQCFSENYYRSQDPFSDDE
jgi:hypothetical protein